MFLYLIKQFNEATAMSRSKFMTHRQRERMIERRQEQLEAYSASFISYLKEKATKIQRKETLKNQQLIIYINSPEGKKLKEEMSEAGLFNLSQSQWNFFRKPVSKI